MLADHGAEVEFCARSEEAIQELAAYKPESGQGSVRGHQADMGGAESVKVFLDAVESGGVVDILINNVGASPSRNFLYMTDEDWISLFSLNLLSAVRCTKRFLPGMRKQKWGRVVMVASGAAKSPGAALIDYGASKAAMIATGKALSGKYGRDNVLVNSVIPGLIHTAMWERAATEIAEASGSTMEQVIANNSKQVPVGRYGTAEEVAAAITFLCTESASYINGSLITVDGGQAQAI
jgi:3-oxoacyl-[acyl-carrier protein] reductase